MPLTKLFQKRHSLKDTSLVQETNKELEKLKSSFQTSRLIDTIKSQSESNLMTANLDEDTSTSITRTDLQLFSSAVEEDISNKYDYIEKESGNNSFNEELVCTDERRQSAPPESFKRSDIKAFKSASYSEQQFLTKITSTSRRKCASESNADDLESNENNNSKKVQLDNSKLEDMIGRCINRIIKESIQTAVKNVNVESLYKEIIENISIQRHNFSDSGSNFGEKCPSDVADYVELDESNFNFRTEEKEEQDDMVDEDKTKDSLSYSEEKKIETRSLDSYCADIEESVSLHSIDFKEQTIAAGTFSNADSTNENNILTETSAQISVTFNDEDDVAINNDKDSLSKPSTKISTPVKPESENINLMCDAKIADGSPKSDSINSRGTSLENKVGKMDKDHEIDRDDLTKINESPNSFEEKCEQTDNVLDEEPNLMVISDDADNLSIPKSVLCHRDSNDSVLDSFESLPSTPTDTSEEKKTNSWKVGYLHVKLPHKERGKKAHLKGAWKKRCVSIQADEFVNDPKNPCLMLSLYSAESGTARKHGATFWKSISCHKAAVYRSSSRSHKYAFTITDDNNVVIHLAAESETSSQEWMAAIRSILWPPSPVVQLEKMLYGREFEISIVDNDFSFRAGLLGMYGYLTITEKKLILVHPQQGYVIQEWYLNTVDKFELIPQSRIEDAHKVLSMTTCSDSSTGKGEILMYCPEAVAMLQSIASTIHQILTVHIEQKGGGKYDKELAEIANWLVPATSPEGEGPEDYYKVPPRQVKSLLDIPNFIFDKPLTPSTTVTCSLGESMESKSLQISKSNATRASQDSGISAGNISEDMLNCSSSSFLVGGGQFPGKSSDSELSDSYTPPRSPVLRTNKKKIGSSTTLQIP